MLKRNVLRDKKDFSRIYTRGKSIGDKYVVLFYKENGLAFNRTAFLASKKVGNSVQRNRSRRLLRESFRNIQPFLPEGFDFIIIARNTILGKKCEDVEKSLYSAFKRTGALKK